MRLPYSSLTYRFPEESTAIRCGPLIAERRALSLAILSEEAENAIAMTAVRKRFTLAVRGESLDSLVKFLA